MKKVILCIISICLAFALCSCGRVSAGGSEPVELKFHYDGASVDAVLSEQDSEVIRNMFDGKELYFDDPSCGFNENVSLRVDGKVFCPACDKCAVVKDCGSGQYFELSESERRELVKIFSQHGGSFPCV